jgi:hypothetical protein
MRLSQAKPTRLKTSKRKLAKPRGNDEDTVEGAILEPCVVEPCPDEETKKKKIRREKARLRFIRCHRQIESVDRT